MLMFLSLHVLFFLFCFFPLKFVSQLSSFAVASARQDFPCHLLMLSPLLSYTPEKPLPQKGCHQVTQTQVASQLLCVVLLSFKPQPSPVVAASLFSILQSQLENIQELCLFHCFILQGYSWKRPSVKYVLRDLVNICMSKNEETNGSFQKGRVS